VATRSQFKDSANRIAFCDKTLFNNRKIFQCIWVILTYYYINKICYRELRNSLIYKCYIVDAIEMPEAFIVAVLIKGILLF